MSSVRLELGDRSFGGIVHARALPVNFLPVGFLPANFLPVGFLPVASSSMLNEDFLKRKSQSLDLRQSLRTELWIPVRN
jgi:hypothetical protein